jgi:hypothetical protein
MWVIQDVNFFSIGTDFKLGITDEEFYTGSPFKDSRMYSEYIKLTPTIGHFSLGYITVIDFMLTFSTITL